MGHFEKACETLLNLEFSKPKNYLHKNKGESGYTVAGIYQVAHPSWEGLEYVDTALSINNTVPKASEWLYNNKDFNQLVYDFYKYTFWDKMKLDLVKSEKIATEIFVMAVNTGKRAAIRKAQKVVGVETDGLVGPVTIKALNEFNEDRFDYVFDHLEIEYYKDLIEKKPSLAMFQKGWENRAYAV